MFASAANNGTYNTGDTINGNGKTVVDLVVNVAAAQTVIADVNNVAAFNVNLAASPTGNRATVDMSEFDDVAQLALTRGSNGQFLDVTAAQLGTTYAINVARTVTLDIQDFVSDTAAGTNVNLSFDGAGVSGSRTAASQVYANTANVVLTSGTTDIENITVATSGSNFVQLQETADLELLTINGSGTNTIVVGTGVTDLEVDASGATGANTIDLLDNLSIGADTTVTGGSGNDTVRGILNAGTTAANLTSVEEVGLTFANAGSFFTAVNTSGLTTASIIDSTDGTNIVASDESASLSALQSVSTLNIRSTGTTNADAVNATYVTGSTGDLTINIGSTYDDVDVGAITVSNLTGALELRADGRAASGGETIATVTNATASKVDVKAVTSSLDVTTGITAARATEVNLSAVAGLTNDVNAITVGRATADNVITAVTLTATGTNTAGDTGSTVVTNFTAVDLTTGTFTVDAVTLVSDADGVVSFTASQSANDDVTITSVDATAAEGDGVVINLSNITENGSTVSTGAGSATVSLTAADDTFNGGTGDSEVTTVDGADTINGGAGVDTVIMSTSNDGITINSFTAGATGDVANFDVSGWANPLDSAGNAVGAGAVVVAEIASGAAYTFAAAAGADVLVLTGVIADDVALEVDMETYMSVTTNALVSGEDILVAYFDGFSTQLRTVDLTTVAAAGGATERVTSVTVVAGGAELVGIDTADLVASNFFAS